MLNTAKVEPGSTVAILGLGGIGLSVVQGAVMAGAERIIAIDMNPRRSSSSPMQLGATDCINPKDVSDIEAHIVEMTDGGVDYSFECIGNVETMGTALRITHKGWGQSIIIGVAGAGQGDPRAALPAGHRPRLARERLRRDEGANAAAGPRRPLHERPHQARRDGHEGASAREASTRPSS